MTPHRLSIAATEPELLIPLSCVLDPNVGSHPQCEIAICGDPRQLSPQIYSNNSDSLGRSFLERLLRRPVTALGGGEASLLGPMKSSDLIVEGASSLGECLNHWTGSEHDVFNLLDFYSQMTLFDGWAVDLIRYYHKCEGQVSWGYVIVSIRCSKLIHHLTGFVSYRSNLPSFLPRTTAVIFLI